MAGIQQRGEALKREELETILDKVGDVTRTLLSSGKAEDIRNERIFHHMFSGFLGEYYRNLGLDVWKDLVILPEAPTNRDFWREGFDYPNVDYTRKHALDNHHRGRRAEFDFKIRDRQSIVVEWKGPSLFEEHDVAWDLLKLFSQPPDLKVFAAIIAGPFNASKSQLAEQRFERAMRFARDVLNAPGQPEDFFLAHVIMVSDRDSRKLGWRKSLFSYVCGVERVL